MRVREPFPAEVRRATQSSSGVPAVAHLKLGAPGESTLHLHVKHVCVCLHLELLIKSLHSSFFANPHSVVVFAVLAAQQQAHRSAKSNSNHQLLTAARPRTPVPVVGLEGILFENVDTVFDGAICSIHLFVHLCVVLTIRPSLNR